LNVGIDLPQAPPPPQPPAAVQRDPKAAAKWWQEWQLTPGGQAWKGIQDANERLRDASAHYSASVDRDGTFRIDDIPPGNYVMNIYFDRQNGLGKLRNYKFAVPADSANQPAQPVDLGAIKLEQ
jgi:hypothetical protein